MSTKKQKLLQAIKNKEIVDDKSALIWVLEQKRKDKIIEEVVPQVKGEKGEKGNMGGKGERGLAGRDGRTGRDGQTPNIEQIVARAVKMVLSEVLTQIPDIRDIEADLPLLKGKIRDGLELLKDDERLDVSAIKGLSERINKMSRKIVGGGSIARNFYQLFDVPQNYAGQTGKMLSVKSDETGLEFTTAAAVASETTDLSAQCDGATTEFALGQTVINVIVVNLSGTLVDFTLNAAKTDITLTFAPDSGEELKAIVLI